MEAVPLLLELFGGEVLILIWVEGHGAVHYEAVVVEPRADDDNATSAIETNFAEWLAGGGVGLNVPSSDTVGEILRTGNHDVSFHWKHAESPNVV
jgi:hypothetical protein